MDHSLDSQLQRIVQHAYAHAPAARDIFDRASVSPAAIRAVADLERLPVTTKDELAARQQLNPPFGGFLAIPPERLKNIFLSPGPLYTPWTGEIADADSWQRAAAVGGIEPGDVALGCLSYHLVPVGLLMDAALKRLGVTVVPAGVGNADLQVKLLRDLKVTFYFGTPSWLISLIQKAEELGYDFRQEFALRKALVSAEPLPPSLRQTLVEKYGLRVTNAYGTAELGLLAYDSEGAMALRLMASPVIEVVDPDTGRSVGPGEVGEVVVTSFNESYPLIRLGTGDMAVNVDSRPGESRQEERAIILVGRRGEALKVRGMFVHPNQLRFALAAVPGVVRAQAIITRPENRDELTLRVVAAGEPDREQLSAALGEAIRSTCRVRLDRVEFISANDLEENAKLLVDLRSWE
jgi:phenylacetate-CoA ligase